MVFRRFNDSHEEFRWNTESEDAVNKGPHYFQMEESLKQLLEIMKTIVHNLDVEIGQIYL